MTLFCLAPVVGAACSFAEWSQMAVPGELWLAVAVLCPSVWVSGLCYGAAVGVMLLSLASLPAILHLLFLFSKRIGKWMTKPV